MEFYELKIMRLCAHCGALLMVSGRDDFDYTTGRLLLHHPEVVTPCPHSGKTFEVKVEKFIAFPCREEQYIEFIPDDGILDGDDDESTSKNIQ